MQLFLSGTGITVLYIAIAVGIVLLGRCIFTIPDELLRKILHFVLLGAYIPLVFAFEDWWMAAFFAVALIIILFPVLFFAEKIPVFSSFVNERKKGEFKSSMVLAVGMMAFSVSVCWGLFGDKYLVLASIYAWGVGDAFAALVGKRFGKRKIKLKLADGKKSVEGSLTMFLCSFISVFAVLLVRGGIMCKRRTGYGHLSRFCNDCDYPYGSPALIIGEWREKVMEWIWYIIASVGAGFRYSWIGSSYLHLCKA